MKSTKLFYTGLVIFFMLGLSMGVAGTLSLMEMRRGVFPPPPLMGPSDGDDQYPKYMRMFEHLKVELQIKPDQEAKVIDILKQDSEKMEVIMKEQIQHMDELMERICSVLTPEQADRMRNLHERMKHHFPKP